MSNITLYEVDDGVAWLTINRPEARNALNRAARDGLLAGVQRFNADDSAQVLVLTGAGDKAFCAGGDLKEMAATQLKVPPPDFVMQFGRTIASFQSMKHKQADMLVDVELAKSAAYMAASAAAEDDADLPALASLAKACASDAYIQTAIHTIQIHGGIGFTWDNDTHLWFKRAKSSEVFLGDPTYHRELMMRAWGV